MTHKEIARRSHCQVRERDGAYRIIMVRDVIDVHLCIGGRLSPEDRRADGLHARRVRYFKKAHPRLENRLLDWLEPWEFATEDEAWSAIESLL